MIHIQPGFTFRKGFTIADGEPPVPLADATRLALHILAVSCFFGWRPSKGRVLIDPAQAEITSIAVD
jgi:hypothetical protein